jgi:hypothetical protein
MIGVFPGGGGAVIERQLEQPRGTEQLVDDTRERQRSRPPFLDHAAEPVRSVTGGVNELHGTLKCAAVEAPGFGDHAPTSS